MPEKIPRESLIQVETKSGLAIEWQNDKVPPGRIMPRYVPSDTGPLIQVETKPQVDFKETLASEDHTPKEWRDKLREFIEGAKEN
jgi:hypothetical protein